MHYIVKLICITVLCVGLCSCGGKGRRVEREVITHESDIFVINSEKITFDLGEEGILNSDIEADRTAWISDFESRVQNNKIRGSEIPNMQIRHKVYENSENLISMVTEKYLYISGVHGNIWWNPRNFDVLNNSYLTLNDLFYDDEYKEIVNSKMEQMLEDEPEKYHDLWEKPAIKNGIEDYFYIDDKCLVIFFQPYELSFYAKGVVEFPIEADELRGYIKEEYLKMMS